MPYLKLVSLLCSTRFRGALNAQCCEVLLGEMCNSTLNWICDITVSFKSEMAHWIKHFHTWPPVQRDRAVLCWRFIVVTSPDMYNNYICPQAKNEIYFYQSYLSGIINLFDHFQLIPGVMSIFIQNKRFYIECSIYHHNISAPHHYELFYFMILKFHQCNHWFHHTPVGNG